MADRATLEQRANQLVLTLVPTDALPPQGRYRLRDAIATTIREAVEADRDRMWIPISEAPKDGDILIGWHDGERWRYAIGWREKFTRAPEFEFATHFQFLPEGLSP